MTMVQQSSDDPQFCSERIVELARPKEPRSIWITSVGSSPWQWPSSQDEKGPRVMWGTQETLWPVSGSAMAHDPTPRLKELAWPKRNFQNGDKVNRPEFMYSCGRSSMVWQVSPNSMGADPTERLLCLANHKKNPQEFVDKEDRRHFVFSCGRSSPIWRVSKSARAGSTRPRVEELARPKTTHNDYLPMRSVATIIPRPALNSRCTERVGTLAEAKNRDEGPFREPQWNVTDGARSAATSVRVGELAKPKSLAEGYVPSRPVIMPVSRSARKANCTNRLDEISKPIIRATMDHVQFDPDAFLVKDTALKARCSNRLQELAEPLRR